MFGELLFFEPFDNLLPPLLQWHFYRLKDIVDFMRRTLIQRVNHPHQLDTMGFYWFFANSCDTPHNRRDPCNVFIDFWIHFISFCLRDTKHRNIIWARCLTKKFLNLVTRQNSITVSIVGNDIRFFFQLSQGSKRNTIHVRVIFHRPG